MQCLLHVGVPGGFAYSPPYHRFPGERRFDLEQEVIPLLQNQKHPWSQTFHCQNFGILIPRRRPAAMRTFVT